MGVLADAERLSASALEEQFIGLVCGDDELVQAEFDALVAAEWRECPAGPPGDRGFDDRCVPGGTGYRGGHRGGEAHRPPRARRPGSGEWVRQRSPPFTG